MVKIDNKQNAEPTGVTILTTPEKSPSDKKEYRAIKLANGLVALLISDVTAGDEDEEPLSGDEEPLSGDEEDGEYDDEEDLVMSDNEHEKPEVEKAKRISAAAMAVSAGSFHEPSDCGGLAHFCEHMIFMGSKKYPDENLFDSFVSKFSGSDNAYTDCEATVYEMDVAPSKFKEALDIWAQFFVDPLMKKDSVEREVTAVNSEFEMSRISDSVRKYQIIQEALMKPGHPQGNFMWGNKISLIEDLKKRNESAYDLLHKWYPNNYSANWMNLAIQSPHSLDELQEWVEEIFSAVPNRGLPQPAGEPNYAMGHAFEDTNVSRLVTYIPLKDVHMVDVSWGLSPQKKHYQIKPLHYLGWLIGHEGKGSILSEFKKQNWAHDIAAGNEGSGSDHNGYYSDFSLQIRVTDKGLAEWDQMIATVFQYLNMLKTLSKTEQKRIFEEIQKIEKLNWETKEDKKSLSNCVEASENMRRFPSSEWLTGDDLLKDYSDDVITSALNQLGPKNCFVILSSNKFDNKTLDLTEKWTGAQYKIEDLNPEIIKKWQNPGTNANLFVPPHNKYLAESLDIKDDEESLEWEYVQKIAATKEGEVWFKADDQFKLPRAFIRVLISSELPRRNAKNNAMFDFFPFILSKVMAEVAYDAETALLGYSFKSGEQGFRIQVEGLNDKLTMLLDTVLDQIENFHPTQIEFDELKKQFFDNYKNSIIRTQEYSKDLRLVILEDTKWPLLEKRVAFQTVELPELVQFVKDLRQKCYVVMHCQGNYYKKEIEKTFFKVLKNLNVTGTSPGAGIRVLKLPEEKRIIKVQNLNPVDVNSEFIWYWQLGELTIKQYALYDLLVTIMEEPCFNFLRTQKTLGYTVFPMLRDTYGIGGISITVRSQKDKFLVEEVKTCIEEFFTMFKDLLVKMKKDEFEDHRAGLIESKSSDDTKLKQLYDRWYGEIESGDLRFDRLDTEIDFLGKIEKSEIISAFERVIENNDRQLIIAIEGNDPGKEYDLDYKLDEVTLPLGDAFKEFEVISDVRAFKGKYNYFEKAFINKTE